MQANSCLNSLERLMCLPLGLKVSQLLINQKTSRHITEPNPSKNEEGYYIVNNRYIRESDYYESPSKFFVCRARIFRAIIVFLIQGIQIVSHFDIPARVSNRLYIP